jgi:hypothetical protein
MTEYDVLISRGNESITVTIDAKKFEIEDGVLVFYEDENATGTIGDMVSDEKATAFNNWDEVHRQ